MAEKKQWTLQSLGEAIAVHIAGDSDRDEKLKKVYEVLITGNGHEAITQTVSRNTDWINSVKKFLWIGITAIVTMLVTGGVTITYMVIRIYPLLQAIDKLEIMK